MKSVDLPTFGRPTMPADNIKGCRNYSAPGLAARKIRVSKKAGEGTSRLSGNGKDPGSVAKPRPNLRALREKTPPCAGLFSLVPPCLAFTDRPVRGSLTESRSTEGPKFSNYDQARLTTIDHDYSGARHSDLPAGPIRKAHGCVRFLTTGFTDDTDLRKHGAQLPSAKSRNPWSKSSMAPAPPCTALGHVSHHPHD